MKFGLFFLVSAIESFICEQMRIQGEDQRNHDSHLILILQIFTKIKLNKKKKEREKSKL